MREMLRKAKLLKPIKVAKNSIRRDDYFANAYRIDLPLDSTPDHVWQHIFSQKWKASRHLWDRKLYLIGDNLRLLTTPNQFEEKLAWVEHIVNETNKAIDEHNRAVRREEGRERRIKKEFDKQEQLDEQAKLEMFWDVLRKRFA